MVLASSAESPSMAMMFGLQLVDVLRYGKIVQADILNRIAVVGWFVALHITFVNEVFICAPFPTEEIQSSCLLGRATFMNLHCRYRKRSYRDRLGKFIMHHDESKNARSNFHFTIFWSSHKGKPNIGL